LAPPQVFGPVLSLRTFKDEAEAVAMANDTTYVKNPLYTIFTL
jgi:acyl-CoA reductase-like NAD-dependent aldehyde dehydrogenase